MGIELIVTIWMLLAGCFVLALCSAAARPVPRATDANVREHNCSNCETKLKTAHPNSLQPVLWLAIVLAILTTSCASTNPDRHVSRSVNSGTSDPVKGATLLMDHSR